MHYDWYFNPFLHFLLVTDELYIERFSNECQNQNQSNHSIQSQWEQNTKWTNHKSKQIQIIWVKSGKTCVSKSRLVLVLHLIGWESGASFFNQLESMAKQNPSKHNITFDTQLKSALW